jgi:hypothetical protein
MELLPDLTARIGAEALALPADATPVDFLSAVYRDPAQPMHRRLRAAIEAAPYLHPKLSVTPTAAEMPSSGTCFSVRRFARAADLQGGRRAEMPAINRSRGRAFADRHQPRRGNPACANACIRPENTIEGTAPAGSQPTVLTVRLA